MLFYQEFIRVIGLEKVETLEHNKRVTDVVWKFMLDNSMACRDNNFKLNRVELLYMTIDRFNFNTSWNHNPDLMDWLHDMTGKIK